MNEKLGHRLRWARERYKCDPSVLAAEADVSLAEIEAVERGERIPTAGLMEAYSRKFRIDLKELRKGLTQ